MSSSDGPPVTSAEDVARPNRVRRRATQLTLTPVALVVTGIVGLPAVLVMALLMRADEPGAPPVTAINFPAPTFTPTATAPATEAQRIHNALHDIGALCSAAPSGARQRRLNGDVQTILTFARRYPEATFAIDDETGRALTLLMTTRQTLRTCAPDAAARVNRAMPAQFQDGSGAPTPTPARHGP